MAGSLGAALEENDTPGSIEGRSMKGAFIALAAVVALAGAATWRLAGDDIAAWISGAAEGEQTAASGDADLDRLLAATQASPDSAEAWQRLAFAYFIRNQFTQAAEAYGKATDLAPQSAVLWSSLGESLVMASQDDPMPAAALAAFRKAVEIDSADPRARYFLAVARDLEDDHVGAIDDWLALLADTPPGAPWETDLVRTISQVGQREGMDLQSRIDQALATRSDLPQAVMPANVMAGIPGPSQEEIAAASSIPPSQQQDMAEQMVARLAARLDSNPQNVDGWIMLMRSYRQLGQGDRARSAYGRALEANPQAAEQLRAAAGTLGM
jgi:cytochrome c-type biogenesis protein CcmH